MSTQLTMGALAADAGLLLGTRRAGAIPPAPFLTGRPEVIAHREQLDVELLVDQAPQATPREQRHRDGHQAQDDQVPRVVGLQRLLQDYVDDRPDDRALDRAEAADDRRER